MSRTRKAAPSKKQAPPPPAPLISEERKREIIGLCLMVIAFLLGLAVLSYHPADTRIIRNQSLQATLDGINPEHNWLGYVGANLAEIMVENGIGYFAILPLIILFVWGYYILTHRPYKRVQWWMLSAVLLGIFGATFGEWLCHNSAALDVFHYRWAGGIGTALGQQFIAIFGNFGSFVLLLLILAVLLLASIDGDIQKTLFRIETGIKDAKTYFKSWWEVQKTKSQERRQVYEQERAQYESEKTVLVDKTTPIPADSPARPKNLQSTIRIHNEAEEPANPDFDLKRRKAELAQLNFDVPAIVPPPPPTPRDEFADLDAHVQAHKSQKTPPKSGELVSTIHETVVEEEAQSKRIRQPLNQYPFNAPSLDVLDKSEKDGFKVDRTELKENEAILIEKLATYNIEIIASDIIVGPTVTSYEFTPAPNVKISRIKALEDDLAMAVAARGIRIIAPIPGKSAIGIEIANKHRELVRLHDVLNTRKFQETEMALPIAIGKTIDGQVYMEDLAKMPHVLIAGATGSGKSVAINSLIAGLLYACPPSDLKFAMIDPKKIELQQYQHIMDHYIAMPEDSDTPIITDFKMALGLLKSCEKEMEQRYDLLAEAGVRSIKDYNKRIKEGKLAHLDSDHRHLPYIVVVVDELADLMMTAGKEIEGPIARLAQMARAVGIHLVLATQRPSVDVITGLIKANFPARIAFQTSSRIDSRTILDQMGAEQLVGNGDLLYMTGSKMVRLQNPFVSVDEIDRLMTVIGKQKGAGPYILPPAETESDAGDAVTFSADEKRDKLYNDAARIIVRSQQGSVSLLQRKLGIGYARAARLVDQLEQGGIVGPFEGSKARQVLIASEYMLEDHLDPE